MAPITNAFSGIVITAQDFNASILTETWLVSNSLVRADDLVGLRVFSEQFVQFQTKRFQLLLLPSKLQLTFSILGEDAKDDSPKEIAARVVELLPHTPFRALGLNFDFFTPCPEGVGMPEYTRALLGDGTFPLLRDFASTDARFGRYMSKDFGEARLKLEVKPVHAGPSNEEMVQFSFNFHHSLDSIDAAERAEGTATRIRTWPNLLQYAEELVSRGSIVGGNGQ